MSPSLRGDSVKRRSHPSPGFHRAAREGRVARGLHWGPASAIPQRGADVGIHQRSERRTITAPEGHGPPGASSLRSAVATARLGSRDPGSDPWITGERSCARGGLPSRGRHDPATMGWAPEARRDLAIHSRWRIPPVCSWTVSGTCPAYTAPGIRVTGVRPRRTPSRSSLKSKSALAAPSGTATIQDVEPRRGLLGSRIDGWGFRVATATATAFAPSLRTGRTSGHPGSSLPGQQHESGTQEWMARRNRTRPRGRQTRARVQPGALKER